MSDSENQKFFDDIMAENLRNLEKVLAGRVDEGTRCLACGAEITKLRQVKRCVYAEPCGHRQYQGKVEKRGD